MFIAWANNGGDVRMFGGALTNHVILFGRKKVGRRAKGGTVVGHWTKDGNNSMNFFGMLRCF